MVVNRRICLKGKSNAETGADLSLERSNFLPLRLHDVDTFVLKVVG